MGIYVYLGEGRVLPTTAPPGDSETGVPPACSRPEYGLRYSPKKHSFYYGVVYVLHGKAFVAHFVRSSGGREGSW